METFLMGVLHQTILTTPHSLGKLIEWKRPGAIWGGSGVGVDPPHSLGKLIEWKRKNSVNPLIWRVLVSPLAGETN